jgi:uroporphyrinogen-III synthase
VKAIVARSVRAVIVTTQVQAKNLFEIAETIGERPALTAALQGGVVVAAVGPTCARTLTELGAPPHIVPEQSKMGPLVMALAIHLGGNSEDVRS